MEKQAKIRSLPFLSALHLAHELYDLTMKEDDFIEMGYKVWRDIGNVAPVLTRFFTKVPEDYVIELPPHCEFVESVTIINRPIMDSNFDSAGRKDFRAPANVNNVVTPHMNASMTTSPGESVNYSLEVGAVKITSPEALGNDIMVVYRSILTGEDGLPLLNDKEVAAIAAEVTKRITIRRAFMDVNSNKDVMTFIIAEAARCMAAAKIDEYINDDAVDRLLDIKTSWDRKTFGHRFNIIR